MLNRQTVAPSDFELVVAASAPTAAVRRLLAVARAQDRFAVRTVVLPACGSAQLRNAAVAAATQDYLLWADPRDAMAPSYLQAMLAEADPAVVAVARVTGEGTSPRVLGRRLTGRLVPAAWARTSSFTEGLADLVQPDDVDYEASDYWAKAMAAARPVIRIVHGSGYEPAVPLRWRRPDTYETGAAQQLAFARLLDSAAAGASADTADLISELLGGPASIINEYLRAHPGDQPRVVDDLRKRPVTRFPYSVMNSGLASGLVIAYGFPTFSDTSGLVFARRTRERAEVVDVISQDMSNRRSIDVSSARIAEEFIDRHVMLPGKATGANWQVISRYCRDGLAAIHGLERARDGLGYQRIYSRAMWPASHFLGALAKLRMPQAHWLAEFSDPVLHGLHGDDRVAELVDNDVLELLRSGLRDAGIEAPASTNVYEWCEFLPYALADEILFTNENQRTYMLSYAPAGLRDRIEAISSAVHHPTPPAYFYRLAESSIALDPERVNIAYFGVFYPTRGLRELTEGLAMLPEDERRKLAIHAFVPDPQELIDQLEPAGLTDIVIAHPYVPYLEMLRLTTMFDCLLVDDFQTAASHPINPYLPSKWSDYLGSGTAVWAITEPTSILNAIDMAYKSPSGDPVAAAGVLRSIAASGGGR